MANGQTQVILVTKDDEPRGVMEKLEAHQRKELHRAFSIFIFNDKGEFLLQKRAIEKYHSGGLWSNACCGHPEPGDIMESKIQQRLLEEMGVVTPLRFGFKFSYTAAVGNGLTENELDYVFFGTTSAVPDINKAEVSAWRYVSIDELREEIKLNPEIFTAWFKLIYEKAFSFYLLNHIT